MYRGIYKGLFNGEIPEQFNKELAFTIIYEFFLKINDGYSKKDMEKINIIFINLEIFLIELITLKIINLNGLNEVI